MEARTGGRFPWLPAARYTKSRYVKRTSTVSSLRLRIGCTSAVSLGGDDVPHQGLFLVGERGHRLSERRPPFLGEEFALAVKDADPRISN